MAADVDLQVALLGSSVVTVRAFVGLLTCVLPHVLRQGALKRETFTADATAVAHGLVSIHIVLA